jgi:competence ComEA-like helix-hairpin-helix protein
MQIFNFTPQETKALFFLLVALLIGSGITLYKRSCPQFAPELKLGKMQIDSSPDAHTPLIPEVKDEKINLNRATAAELQLLPGVGTSLSRRIVEFRELKGQFKQIEDIMQVSGIGPKTFERIKDYLTVEDKEEGERR